ncbi:Rad4-domain-containing protein [Hanseniaspora valbyensis NRRL Y-1626]|uniref:Rad4-domain-containing protein n=1 Tax=Hanseniaspora valbyensis NRRL Y-1626 TaxID=766949 RepID=A0A1B7TIH5_9ASCO|nr:Rad4-domain-containing protein [Hanseniaspora valbyensis NRRL Y-1626]
MNSGNKLSKDYFDLIRTALKEENNNSSNKNAATESNTTNSPKRPLKRRKTNATPNINTNSEIKKDVVKGIDYKTLIDLTENDVGEATFTNNNRKGNRYEPRKNVKVKPSSKEVICLDSDSENDNNKDEEYIPDYEENEFSDYNIDPDDFVNTNNNEEEEEDDMFDDDDFEDVEIEGDNSNSNKDNTDGDFTFKVNDTRSIANSKKKMISPELKQQRMTYYLSYIMVLLFVVGEKNNWCNNKKLQAKMDPLLPSKIFNSLHTPKDIHLPVKSTNKLIHGLKDTIVFWSNYFTIDENLDIGYYMRKWHELKTNPLYKVQDFLTQDKFADIILNSRKGSKEVSLLGFVTLLRSVGLNCRLVYNMQPPDISDIGRLPKRELSRYDYKDLMECESFKFPIFWCEVWDKYTKKWLTCDPIFYKTVERHVSNAKTLSKLCPRITKEEQRLVTRFVVAFNKNNQVRDVTPRYTNKYFNKVFMKRFRNNETLDKWYHNYLKLLGKKLGDKKDKGKESKLKIDEYEDKFMEEKLSIESFPESLKDFQNHPKFVLQSKIAKTLYYLPPDTKPVGFFKNDKVFLREILHPLKAKNKWLQEGRVVKEREKPKVVTKSFNNNMNNNTGENKTADKELFIYEQTEPYVPHSALKNGKIITNKFGNIEIYHPSMIPVNCVLIDHPLVVKAADFLKIEYAKAVVGWEYKNSNNSGNRSRSHQLSGKSNRSAAAKFGGIVCLRDFKDAVIAIVEEMESLNIEKKKLEKDKADMREWVNLFKRLKVKERLDGELNQSGWLETKDMIQKEEHEEKEEEKEEEEKEEEEEEAGGFQVEDKLEHFGNGEEEEEEVEEGGFDIDQEENLSVSEDMNFEDFMNEIEN